MALAVLIMRFPCSLVSHSAIDTTCKHVKWSGIPKHQSVFDHCALTLEHSEHFELGRPTCLLLGLLLLLGWCACCWLCLPWLFVALCLSWLFVAVKKLAVAISVQCLQTTLRELCKLCQLFLLVCPLLCLRRLLCLPALAVFVVRVLPTRSPHQRLWDYLLPLPRA